MNKSRGKIIFNLLLLAILIVIIVLVYMLSRDAGRDGRVIGIASPNRIQNTSNEPSATSSYTEFTDGLGHANQSTEFQLDDFGSGIARTDIFIRDINNDGLMDRITRTRVENGTDHFQYQYTIELRNGDEYINITPDDLYTVEATECPLQKIQFEFNPDFRIIKISRPWRDSWTTPTMATRTVYGMANDELYETEVRALKYVCNVADLF